MFNVGKNKSAKRCGSQAPSNHSIFISDVKSSQIAAQIAMIRVEHDHRFVVLDDFDLFAEEDLPDALKRSPQTGDV